MAPGKVCGFLANDRYPVEFLMSNSTITHEMGGACLGKFGADFTLAIPATARVGRAACVAVPCASSVPDRSTQIPKVARRKMLG